MLRLVLLAALSPACSDASKDEHAPRLSANDTTPALTSGPAPTAAGEDDSVDTRAVPSAGSASPEPEQESGAMPAFDHAYSGWNELLGRHVRGDRFNYGGLAKEKAKLDAVLAELAAVTPKQLAAFNEKQRFAYWINVYNAYCVKLVVDNYPVESIRDLGGKMFGRVWDKEYIPLEAHHPDGDDDPLSLNDVEHEILRKQFEDARLHAAINCASISCPPLRGEAFVAERLDKQLDEQMRAFLADTTRNQLEPGKKRVRLSEIFSWFSSDFERDAGSVRAYVARYAPGKDTAWIEKASVSHLDYDWGLNDAK